MAADILLLTDEKLIQSMDFSVKHVSELKYLILIFCKIHTYRLFLFHFLLVNIDNRKFKLLISGCRNSFTDNDTILC